MTDHRVNAARREEPDGVRSADDGHVPGIESALYIRRERNGSLQREVHILLPEKLTDGLRIFGALRGEGQRHFHRDEL